MFVDRSGDRDVGEVEVSDGVLCAGGAQAFLRERERERCADAMLAYEMDGRPLAREHGAPVRVVIPEMYGYKNVKWVERIELVAKPADGFWEKLGYDRDAWVGHSNGRG